MTTLRRHPNILSYGVIWCLLVSGAPPPKPTLGFTVLEANGIDSYQAKVYSQMLRSGVDNAGVYKTLEFSDISLRLAEQGMPERCIDAHCAVAAGQILGADYFGFGTVGKIGKTFTLSMQVIEVRTGRIVRDISKFHNGNKSAFEQKVIPRFALELSNIKKKK